MTPETLRQIGRRLYGRDWQSPLARDWAVEQSTVKRWNSGFTVIPPHVAKHLLLIDALVRTAERRDVGNWASLALSAICAQLYPELAAIKFPPPRAREQSPPAQQPSPP